MRQFQKTAIAMAVTQLAFWSCNAAYGQEVSANTNASNDKNSAVIVVSGQRAALQSAQKLKQDADEVVDSIVAEDIGKLPDRSITEVLSRVVGVTMDRSMSNDPQHYAVEGSGIAIRGLTYVRSELNGRESFSANGGRSLSFTDVPPELMSGVDVYKNPSAEQIEGGVSGLVNLRTAMPFDFKGLKGAVTGSYTYSDLRKGKAQPSGSMLLSNRWNTPFGEFGALIDLASSVSHTRTDELFIEAYYPHTNIEPGKTLWVPRGAQWRSMNWERDRKGQYAAFQWRPNRDFTAALTYFQSKYKESWSEVALLSQETGDRPYDIEVANGKFDANGAFLSGVLSNPKNGGINLNSDRRVSDRRSATRDLALNLQWRISPAWSAKTDFQVVRASTEALDSDVATGIRMQKQTVDLTGNLPRITFDADDIKYLSDPASYYWAYTMEHKDRSKAESKAWKTDLKYDFDHPVLRDVRFGVRLQNRDSRNQNTNPSYNWQAISQPWMLGWQVDRLATLNDPKFAGGATLRGLPNFFGGDVQVPSIIFPDDAVARGYPDSYAKLHTYHDILCAEKGTTCATWPQATFDEKPEGTNYQEEKTRAFYTQLRFGWDQLKYPVDGNIGVRYVKTKSTAYGYTTYNPNLPTFPDAPSVAGLDKIVNITPFATLRNYENDYNNVLPSLNLRMKYNDQLQFRFAAAKAMSRPDFSQMKAYTPLSQTITSLTDANTKVVTITNVSLTGSGEGNPNLMPTTAKSVDLTAEWYFAKAGSLTAAIFNKDLKNVIVNQMYNYEVRDVAGNTQRFVVTGPVNGAHGYARGFELAYQQYYDWLPGYLKGLGVQASFTYVDSKRKLNDGVYSAYCSGGDSASNLNLYINGCDTDGRTFGNMPLQGLSRRTINFALMYERGPISARAAYNWRSRYLSGVNVWGTRDTNGKDTNPASADYGKNNIAWGLPLWQEAYGQLDASIFYNVTEKLRIGLEGTNLTDSKSKQTMQQHAGTFGHAWFVTGPRYTLQANYSF
ncbi:TonB-dependent receptor [Pseudoduganella flava]|uniref:TonB-dependent receptor n=1 Tax=Pseudoduganella flava TaxID=871742 RepID=A0A562Q1S9_9BURK|nr:TonB-dependent receptor [Pseudoduganella flava]QGZ38079.1 TonB-dependent receptor [Pseudoduganella flava]TWI50410.1 TonB-dependent receptor [Pseudoduganella flava]